MSAEFTHTMIQGHLHFVGLVACQWVTFVTCIPHRLPESFTSCWVTFVEYLKADC